MLYKKEMQQHDSEVLVVPPQFQLCLTAGPCQGTTLAPKGFNISVGRTKANKMHIKDHSVSERHAEVCWNGSSWLVRDLGSTNGTKVNGVCLQPMGEYVENHES